MDRETTRRIEDYRRNEAGPLENNLIDELVGRRAGPDGVPPPRRDVRPLGRHDGQPARPSSARRAPPPGRPRNSRASRPAARSASGSRHRRLARAVPAQRRRLARVRRHPRRVPDVHEPAGQGRALARDELEAERRRDRLDVPAPQGRQVPQRQDDDRDGRRREHEAVRGREGLERRPCPRSSMPSGVSAKGDVHGGLPAQVADRRVPVPRQPDDLPGDHPAAAIAAKPGHVGRERHDRHRRRSSSRSTSTRRAPSSSGTTPTGAAGRRSTASRSPSTRARRRWCSRCGRGRSTSRCSSRRRRRSRFKNNSKYTYYQQPTAAHRQLCMRTDRAPFKDPRVRRAVALVINRPQQLAKVMLGAGQVGNDNPFWKGFASTDTVDQAAHAEHRARKGAAGRGRGAEPEVQHHDVELPRPHRSRGVDPGVRAARPGIDVGLEVMDVAQVLRLRAGRGGLRHDDAVAEPHRAR